MRKDRMYMYKVSLALQVDSLDIAHVLNMVVQLERVHMAASNILQLFFLYALANFYRMRVLPEFLTCTIIITSSSNLVLNALTQFQLMS